MRHDPEQLAAAYLSGQMNRLTRARYQRHLLDCPDCWHETQTARTGRLLAESLREVAPADLRDRLRAIPDAEPAPDPGPSRRWRPILLISLAATALLVALALLPFRSHIDQPAPLVTAAQLYHTQNLTGAAVQRPPVPAIGSYTWRTTTRQDLGGIHTTVYLYADQADRRILVLASPTPFPRAAGAHPIDPAPSWTARIDDVSLLCADKNGISWLALARTDSDSQAAGQALELTSAP